MDTLQKTTEHGIANRSGFLFGDLSYKINGILIEAYKELGAYAREKQYGDLLEKKFKERQIIYERELIVGDSGNILDFVIENKIILELKTVPFLILEHFSQVKRYLYQTNLKLGILVNFRTDKLTPKRVLNPSNKQVL
jgi:GxxExxY protein